VLLPGVKTPDTLRVRDCVGPTAGWPGPFGKSEKSPTPSEKKKIPNRQSIA